MLEFWIFLVGPQSMGDWVAQAERAKKTSGSGGRRNRGSLSIEAPDPVVV